MNLDDNDINHSLRRTVAFPHLGITTVMTVQKRKPAHYIMRDEDMYVQGLVGMYGHEPVVGHVPDYDISRKCVYCNHGYIVILESYMYTPMLATLHEKLEEVKLFKSEANLAGGFRFISAVPREHRPRIGLSCVEPQLTVMDGFINLTMKLVRTCTFEAEKKIKYIVMRGLFSARNTISPDATCPALVMENPLENANQPEMQTHQKISPNIRTKGPKGLPENPLDTDFRTRSE
ncbi:hypothetical protein QVD17_20032 [Tagetes erecta]|uniref:Uncharacterized protein n=1 Tax=Tagetes erecta TaxID=13708 RepID=A0AAD8NXI0_TARER|nr:hypothetical protein QVD17_20032 [Tagetes erecta]